MTWLSEVVGGGSTGAGEAVSLGGSKTGLFPCPLVGELQSMGTTLVSSLDPSTELSTPECSIDASISASMTSEAFASWSATFSSRAEGEPGCAKLPHDSASTFFEDSSLLASSDSAQMSISSSCSSHCGDTASSTAFWVEEWDGDGEVLSSGCFSPEETGLACSSFSFLLSTPSEHKPGLLTADPEGHETSLSPSLGFSSCSCSSLCS